MTKSLAPSRPVTSRDSKGIKFMSIVAAAYDKALLSDGGDGEAQCVNDAPGLKGVIDRFINENRRNIDKFKNEEVRSRCGYPQGFKPKDIVEQVTILQQVFSGVGFSANRDIARAPLPQHADGYYVIPRWQSIAPTYGEAVRKVFGALRQSRGDHFRDCSKGNIGPKYLRQLGCSVAMFNRFEAQQPGHSALIIPAQFGLRHRGRSVRRAREVITGTPGEFGLGVFAVGTMLLTHPERMIEEKDLCVDCSGDEYSLCADGDFSFGASFFWHEGELRFVTSNSKEAYEAFGTASGFFPQR